MSKCTRMVESAIESNWRGFMREPPKQKNGRQTSLVDDLTDTELGALMFNNPVTWAQKMEAENKWWVKYCYT